MTKMANKHIDEATGVETVGHEWDGIEELNNPLPRWWVLTFYATILFAIGYVFAYPAIPLLHRATGGMLGWSSRGQLAKDLTAQSEERAKAVAGLASMPIEQLPQHPQLEQAAIAGGAAAFKVNCIQCHGAGAAGIPGSYPNLSDDDWLWGGDLVAIETTITHGIRSPDDSDTRTSAMPAFGRDGILTAQQIGNVADHVLHISGNGPENAAGAQVFAENCAVCHGAEGKGNRSLGAPNLTDAIWLYGKTPGKITKAEIESVVTNARNSVMPAWGKRLSPLTIKELAAYVHSLGGGEDFVEEAAAPPAEQVNDQP
jgi:cytochrome c oxidase cbb3-type subunit 3